MALDENIFSTLKTFIESKNDTLEFAILFGSSVLNVTPSQADIDFKIFLRSEAPVDLRRQAAKFAQKINQKLSNISKPSSKDVPYEIKTIISKSTLESSLNLKAFININGDFAIPKICFTRKFLTSEECQMRTVLSSLTTPNRLIAGDAYVFENVKKHAFKSLKKLICNVYDVDIDNIQQILSLLLESPDGRRYKNYLGYNDSEDIKNHLLQHISDWNV